MIAHAHEHGVHVQDETGVHFIPYQKPPARWHRRPEPAADPEGTDSPYKHFSPPLCHTVLPPGFHLGQLHVRRLAGNKRHFL